jgi:hypothetical protein
MKRCNVDIAGTSESVVCIVDVCAKYPNAKKRLYNLDILGLSEKENNYPRELQWISSSFQLFFLDLKSDVFCRIL